MGIWWEPLSRDTGWAKLLRVSLGRMPTPELELEVGVTSSELVDEQAKARTAKILPVPSRRPQGVVEAEEGSIEVLLQQKVHESRVMGTCPLLVLGLKCGMSRL